MRIGHSELILQIYRSGSDVYLSPQGRIILEECERLRSAVLPLITPEVERVIVDLSQVDFIDSAGLGSLVGLKTTARKNGANVILLQPSRPVADILYISKLDGIFDIITDAEADMLREQLAAPGNRVEAEGESGVSPVSETPLPADGGAEGEQPQAPAHETSPDITQAGFAAASVPELRSLKEMIDAHCRRAVEYIRQGNCEMSVEEYRQALKIDPEYLPALNNLAVVYEKKPSWIPKAIEQWETVLQLSQQRGDQKHIDRAQRHLSNLRKMSE